MSQQQSEGTEPRFLIPLPGGRVARVPLEVLERYVSDEARAQHATSTPRSRPETITLRAGDTVIQVDVYATGGQVSVERESDGGDDVVAHSLSVDPTTGTSEWHTDWEYGECEYTSESGFQERIQAWHRHPFATEYTEIYEG